MTIVPETRVGKIQFYQTHLPVWAEDPASIGLTPDAVSEMQQLVDAAREAYDAHSAAQQAARTATAKFYNAVRRMHAGGDGVAGGAALLQLIKTYAQTTGDANVYAHARISAPAKPGRPGSAPAPGTPHRFSTNLRQTGELELIWKCDNPDGTVGTIYQVMRQVDDGPFEKIAMVGEKKFLDRALPPGTRTCTYEVTALRSTGKGEPARYTIQIGNARANPWLQIKPRRLVA